MRRPREVGIGMVMLLVGLSGCAGMPQQGGLGLALRGGQCLSEPEDASARPACVVASAQGRCRDTPGRCAGDDRISSQAGLLASETASPSDASTARPKLLRHFPLLGRLIGTIRRRFREHRQRSHGMEALTARLRARGC